MRILTGKEVMKILSVFFSGIFTGNYSVSSIQEISFFKQNVVLLYVILIAANTIKHEMQPRIH